jgi:hypothetical protein
MTNEGRLGVPPAVLLGANATTPAAWKPFLDRKR